LRALGADAFEHDVRRLVIRVLRNELAAEGLGEDGRFEAVDEGAGARGFGFEAIGAGVNCFKPTHDLGLLLNGRERDPQ
jgi:hypothetical protein